MGRGVFGAMDGVHTSVNDYTRWVALLPDRSAESWVRELAKLKQAVGECAGEAPIKATGMLSGTFEWTCERGAINGRLLPSPTNPPGIQSLRLESVTSH